MTSSISLLFADQLKIGLRVRCTYLGPNFGKVGRVTKISKSLNTFYTTTPSYTVVGEDGVTIGFGNQLSWNVLGVFEIIGLLPSELKVGQAVRCLMPSNLGALGTITGTYWKDGSINSYSVVLGNGASITTSSPLNFEPFSLSTETKASLDQYLSAKEADPEPPTERKPCPLKYTGTGHCTCYSCPPKKLNPGFLKF